jgi:hypothetical protein
VCSCPASVGNAGFSRFYHYRGYCNRYSSQGNRGLASIIDLLYTNSALESRGSSPEL